MKKLKVILPAILTLAVSTSAAVTGTVAWFQSTRLKTIAMEQITAVNPESGLEINAITAVANTKLDRVDTEHNNKPLAGQDALVTHAYGGTTPTQGYFRDGSVDVANDKVYKGILDREGSGEIVGYGDVTSTYTTPEAPTYSGKPVFYADCFSVEFTITNGDPNVNTGLFLNLATSTITLPHIGDADVDPTDNNASADAKLYRALRFGFHCGTEWFVWAPFAVTEATASKYVKGQIGSVEEPATTQQLETNQQAYATTNFVRGVGNADSGLGATDKTARVVSLDDSNGPLDNGVATGYIGYLGNLKAKTAAVTNLTVKVYTWFEGLDADCKNDNFTTALATGLRSNLNFISRKFADQA